MTKANMLMSLTAAALSLGFSVQPHPAPLWETNIVIVEETSLKGNIQTDEDSSTAKSPKMGKDEGTQTGSASQRTPPENDAHKVDQPPRQNPSTGDQ